MKTIVPVSSLFPKSLHSDVFDHVYEKYAGSVNGLVLQHVNGHSSLADEITARVFVHLFAAMKAGTVGTDPTFNTIFTVLLEVFREDGLVFTNPFIAGKPKRKMLSPVPARVYWAI